MELISKPTDIAFASFLDAATSNGHVNGELYLSASPSSILSFVEKEVTMRCKHAIYVGVR